MMSRVTLCHFVPLAVFAEICFFSLSSARAKLIIKKTKVIMYFFFSNAHFHLFSLFLQIGAKRKLLPGCVDRNTERPTGVLVTPRSLSRLFERDLTM